MVRFDASEFDRVEGTMAALGSAADGASTLRGSFRLSYLGEETAPIEVVASGDHVAALLEALSTTDGSIVVSTDSYNATGNQTCCAWVITFADELGDLETLVVSKTDFDTTAAASAPSVEVLASSFEVESTDSRVQFGQLPAEYQSATLIADVHSCGSAPGLPMPFEGVAAD